MLSLVIAFYNEEAACADAVTRVRQHLDGRGEPWELILVDDGSLDRTLERLEELAASDHRLRVFRQPSNLGQGAAVRRGLLFSRGEIVAYVDADLSVPMPFLETLIERLRRGADVAVASRWIEGARIRVQQPVQRRILGRLYYRIAHAAVFDGVRDANCGMKAYRGEAARALFARVHSRRWAFNIEHLWLADRLGFLIAEIPTEWSHRSGSRVRLFRDALFTLWELLALRWRQYRGCYPRSLGASTNAEPSPRDARAGAKPLVPASPA